VHVSAVEGLFRNCRQSKDGQVFSRESAHSPIDFGIFRMVRLELSARRSALSVHGPEREC
jgi:hypothetical protein